MNGLARVAAAVLALSSLPGCPMGAGGSLHGPRVELEGTIAARAWLPSGAKEAGDLAAYGYVLLLEAPTAGEPHRRASLLCKAFVGHVPEAGASAGQARRFVTYWPVRSDLGAAAGCESAVLEHDAERLSWLRTCLRLESRRGPVLVAQAVPFRVGERPERLVLDLSDVETDELDHPVDHWLRFTVETPSSFVYNAKTMVAGLLVHGSLGTAKLSHLADGC